MQLPRGRYHFCVYILTNKSKTVLYIGVTNDLKRRITEHEEDALLGKNHFTSKYNAYNLVYWECFKYINLALFREKELKGWIRDKKEILIAASNPEWKFFNQEIIDAL